MRFTTPRDRPARNLRQDLDRIADPKHAIEHVDMLVGQCDASLCRTAARRTTVQPDPAAQRGQPARAFPARVRRANRLRLALGEKTRRQPELRVRQPGVVDPQKEMESTLRVPRHDPKAPLRRTTIAGDPLRSRSSAPDLNRERTNEPISVVQMQKPPRFDDHHPRMIQPFRRTRQPASINPTPTESRNSNQQRRRHNPSHYDRTERPRLPCHKIEHNVQERWRPRNQPSPGPALPRRRKRPATTESGDISGPCPKTSRFRRTIPPRRRKHTMGA